jgi:hypothetical protein
VPAALALTLAGCAEIKGGDHQTDAKASPQGRNWAEIAQLPDWGGVWDVRFGPPARPAGAPGAPPPAGAAPPNPPPPGAGSPPPGAGASPGPGAGARPGPPPPPPFTKEYAAKFAAFQKANKAPGINFVSETANCVPYPLPMSMRLPYPVEFLFTPGKVTVAIETYSMMRRIFTDGRPVPEDPDLTYQGYSVGHWEGDALVVESVGFLPDISVVNGIVGHGPNLKITERMRLTGPDALEIKTTLEDPAMFTEPYTTTTNYQRHRDWDLMEYVCQQNNHDGVDAQGRPFFNLERKPGE